MLFFFSHTIIRDEDVLPLFCPSSSLIPCDISFWNKSNGCFYLTKNIGVPRAFFSFRIIRGGSPSAGMTLRSLASASCLPSFWSFCSHLLSSDSSIPFHPPFLCLPPVLISILGKDSNGLLRNNEFFSSLVFFFCCIIQRPSGYPFEREYSPE